MSSITSPLLAVACALAACTTESGGHPIDAGPAEHAEDQLAHELAGKVWTLVEVDGMAVAARRPPTLRLDRGRATGFGGVNRLSAAYTTQANEITFGAIAINGMARSPDLMKVEGAFVDALERADAFRVTGNVLELSSRGSVVATFRCE
jgi:heat shock protein HslJ